MRATRIALFRGINVGKAKRVGMADLRAMMEGMGYHEVRTLLNSGNVIFDAPKGEDRTIASRTEKALSQKMGISAGVVVVSADELQDIIEANPLPKATAEPARFLLAIFQNTADAVRLKPLMSMPWSPEALALGRRAAYVWCPGGILKSRLLQAVNRAMGDLVTTRNWTTITKLGLTAAGEKR